MAQHKRRGTLMLNILTNGIIKSNDKTVLAKLLVGNRMMWKSIVLTVGCKKNKEQVVDQMGTEQTTHIYGTGRGNSTMKAKSITK